MDFGGGYFRWATSRARLICLGVLVDLNGNDIKREIERVSRL